MTDGYYLALVRSDERFCRLVNCKPKNLYTLRCAPFVKVLLPYQYWCVILYMYIIYSIYCVTSFREVKTGSDLMFCPQCVGLPLFCSGNFSLDVQSLQTLSLNLSELHVTGSQYMVSLKTLTSLKILNLGKCIDVNVYWFISILRISSNKQLWQWWEIDQDLNKSWHLVIDFAMVVDQPCPLHES